MKILSGFDPRKVLIPAARFMSLGFPGRSAATETPGPNDLLPTDDALWDQGVSCHPSDSNTMLNMDGRKKEAFCSPSLRQQQ